MAIDELGQVIAWGEGYYADGTDSMKIVTYPTAINGIDNPIQVSRGKNHNLVLDRNGNVWGWGSNSNNPMGSGLGGKVKTVQRLNGIKDVKQIAAGTEFSLFLKKDGTVWGVGKNDMGQLGMGDTANRSVPEQISGLSGVKKISVGEYYALALTSDGIYSWGGNGLYQLGDGTQEQSETPKKIEVELSEGEYFTDISAGVEFGMALTSAGNVYSWGHNGNGALGYRGTYHTPAKIPCLSNIEKIEAGRKCAFAINKSGRLYSWGYGGDGQLGYSGGSVYTPGMVSALQSKKITMATAGLYMTAVIDADGNLYTFGKNNAGQLGVESSERVKVWSYVIEDIKWLDSQMSAIEQPITDSISLPTIAPNGSTITWTSGNTYYIANDGTLVSRPDCYGSDTVVTMFATLTRDGETYTPVYTVTVKQDPSIQPSTDIPIRSIGMEYDQIYPSEAPDTYPEITAVSMTVIDEANGVYELTVRDDQYNCASNAKPFFFWSARQGTFLPVDGYDDYRSVRFNVDSDALGKSVKVVVGIGDSLGYIDRKAVIINSTASASLSSAEENSGISLTSVDEKIEDGSVQDLDNEYFDTIDIIGKMIPIMRVRRFKRKESIDIFSTKYIIQVYNDMLEYVFTDANGKEWNFDNHHAKPVYENSIAVQGNRELNTYDFGNNAYIADALSMGNYSVTEIYNFQINNDTNDKKKISYIVRTVTPFFYRYSIDNKPSFITGIKCDTSESYVTSNDELIAYELFSFEIEPNSTVNLTLEVSIPNIGMGGIDNMLKAETIQS